MINKHNTKRIEYNDMMELIAQQVPDTERYEYIKLIIDKYLVDNYGE